MVTHCAMILYNIPSAIKDLLRVQDIKMSWHGIMALWVPLQSAEWGEERFKNLFLIIEANAFYFPPFSWSSLAFDHVICHRECNID